MRLLAKYPFLPEAREYLKNVDLERLLSSEEYEDVREKGIMRLRAIFTEEKVRFASDEERFLSFFVAKIILIGIQDPIITRRFANIERDRIEEHLLSDSDQNVEKVASSLNIKFKKISEFINNVNYEYEIHFTDFIKYAKNFSTEGFRLIYQRLKHGWIPLPREKFIKILREDFVENFVRDVERQKEKRSSIEKYFRKEIEELKNLKDEYISNYSPVDFGEVNTDAFPPCIKKIIAMLKNGVNLSHQARFSLVAFLHKIGMSNDEILKIFSSVPDFKENLTKYQIEHITGKISGKEYSMPKCTTMQAYGLCIKNEVNDRLCRNDWMSHPLLYYKIKKGASRYKKPAEQQ